MGCIERFEEGIEEAQTDSKKWDSA